MSQNSKLFKVLDDYIYFDTAQEAHQYARENPGRVVTRNKEYAEDESITLEEVVVKEKKLEKTPDIILEYLNQHIIGQDEAKKEIALALYYHTLKAKYKTNDEIGINGPLMIVGPTGSGKTFITQTACEFMNTVFVHVDASSMVPEGIKGYSISSLADEIMEKAKYDLHKASHCVVFFDEMDKLFHGDDASEYGPKVASQLLRLIEGSNLKLTGGILEKIFREGDADELDTSNIQFILGGAFQWILDSKSETKATMGFKNTIEQSSKEITLYDLQNVGVPKEFLGRMSSIINLQKLSVDDYFNLLKYSESSPLHPYVKKIEFHGDKVSISDDTLLKVAEVAACSDLGVRGMKQILKQMFRDALFNATNNQCQTHEIMFQKIST